MSTATICDGCESTDRALTEGVVIRGDGTTATVHYCGECWEVVDGADPETGAYGAASCDVRRAPAPYDGVDGAPWNLCDCGANIDKHEPCRCAELPPEN